MKKRKPKPEFESLIPMILSGELTRKQAAIVAQALTGLSQKTFFSWITGNKEVRALLKPVNGNRGANNIHAHTDPDKVKAYEDAISAVIGGQSAALVAKRYGVNYQYLCRRSRALMLEKGLTTKYKKSSPVVAIESDTQQNLPDVAVNQSHPTQLENGLTAQERANEATCKALEEAINAQLDRHRV